jgi:hypothetical protein
MPVSLMKAASLSPGGDGPTLLDPFEEALDQIAQPVQIRAKADWVFAISLRRDVATHPVHRRMSNWQVWNGLDSGHIAGMQNRRE